LTLSPPAGVAVFVLDLRDEMQKSVALGIDADDYDQPDQGPTK
jgi:hypothetical protein